MGGDDYKKVFAGQRVRLPAAAFNSMLDSAQALKNRAHDTSADLSQAWPSTGIVYVKNDSGAARDRFDVLGVSAPLILPADNLGEFQKRVTLSGVMPDSASAGNFVILLEPLADGAIGRAVVAGVVPGRVKVTPGTAAHGYADVISGDPSQLQLVACGGAQMLWRDTSDVTGSGGSGSGGEFTAEAVLRLGVSPCGGGCTGEPFPLVTNVCPATGVVQYQLFDPCTGELGAPYCVTNPTDCCLECSCGATKFLVTGEDFTGPFVGFGCGLTLCGCELPPVLCATPSGSVPPGVTAVRMTPHPSLLYGGYFSNLNDDGTVADLSQPVCEMFCSEGIWYFYVWSGILFPTGTAGATGEALAACGPPFSASFSMNGGAWTMDVAPCAEAPTGDGFNSDFLLSYASTCLWSFACPGGATIAVALDAHDIATITYTTAGGDTAIYKVDVSSGCCGTFTAELYSTTAPGDVPETITIKGIGCPEGSGSGSGGGHGVSISYLGSGTSAAPLASVTVAAGALLVVAVGTETANAPIGVTFNGAPMTKAQDSAAGPSTSIWYMAVGSLTTGAITPTLPGGTTAYGLGAFEVFGLASNVTDSGAINSGATSDPVVNVPFTTAAEAGLAAANTHRAGSPPANGAWASPFNVFPLASASFQVGSDYYTLRMAWDIPAAAGVDIATYNSTPDPDSWSAAGESFA